MSIRSVFSMVAGLVMLFYLSWKLTMISLSLIPLIVIGNAHESKRLTHHFLASVVYGKFVKKLSKDFQDSLAKVNICSYFFLKFSLQNFPTKFLGF